MPTFIPPTRTDQGPAVRPGDRSFEAGFARHWAPEARGINVWKLDDGSYTERQPDPAVGVAVTYYGGHSYTVTDTEAAALTAAGYAANLS